MGRPFTAQLYKGRAACAPLFTCGSIAEVRGWLLAVGEEADRCEVYRGARHVAQYVKRVHKWVKAV